MIDYNINDTVDLVHPRFYNHNYLLRDCKIVNKHDGMYDVRTYSLINGYMVLHGIKQTEISFSKGV